MFAIPFRYLKIQYRFIISTSYRLLKKKHWLLLINVDDKVAQNRNFRSRIELNSVFQCIQPAEQIDKTVYPICRVTINQCQQEKSIHRYKR